MDKYLIVNKGDAFSLEEKAEKQINIDTWLHADVYAFLKTENGEYFVIDENTECNLFDDKETAENNCCWKDHIIVKGKILKVERRIIE